MSGPKAPQVSLAEDEREELLALIRAHKTPQHFSFRAQIIVSCVFRSKVGSWPLCVIMESHRLVPASHTAITGIMSDVTRVAAAAQYRLDRTFGVSTF
jgi:hypothetical protein